MLYAERREPSEIAMTIATNARRLKYQSAAFARNPAMRSAEGLAESAFDRAWRFSRFFDANLSLSQPCDRGFHNVVESSLLMLPVKGQIVNSNLSGINFPNASIKRQRTAALQDLAD